MASYGYTFNSGDGVTPTRLNAARTVSDIVNADIKSDAAIAHSKLANIPSGQLLLGNGSNVPTATTVTGDVTISSAGVTSIASGAVTSAKIADGTIVNADINASAAIVDTKLATISTAGKVSNSATTATNANTANAIVSRDASGNFSAGTITAALSGNVTGNLTGTASAIADGTVSTAKIVDANVTTAKLATTTQQSLVPAGAVMPFAMNSAPSGWLAADGTAVSRSTYAALFAAIGVTHGAGDSVTTFNLPDLRGIFVRGSGSQTISGTTYSGTFAAKQQDDFKSHTHKTGGNIAGASLSAGSALSTLPGFNTSQFTEATGGTETRPANIAMLYCIKF